MAEYNLWRHVLWGAADSVSAGLHDLSETHVVELQVVVVGEQQAFRFYVPVEDVVLVQVLDCQHHLRSVEPELTSRTSLPPLSAFRTSAGKSGTRPKCNPKQCR